MVIYIITVACSCQLLFPNVARQAHYTCWMRGFFNAFVVLFTFLREVGFNLLLAVCVFKVDLFPDFNSCSYRWQTIISLTPIKIVLLQLKVLFRIFGLTCCHNSIWLQYLFPSVSPLKSAGSSIVILCLHWLMFHDFQYWCNFWILFYWNQSSSQCQLFICLFCFVPSLPRLEKIVVSFFS